MPNNPYNTARQAQIKAIRKRATKKSPRPYKKKHTLSLDSGSNTQKDGFNAEALACDYLINQGLSILAKNLSCKLGEIDIIALDQSTLVFIEVRKRSSNNFGSAAASIDKNKQAKLIRTANYFLPVLYFKLGRKLNCRFDVLTYEADKIHWIQSAFSS